MAKPVCGPTVASVMFIFSSEALADSKNWNSIEKKPPVPLQYNPMHVYSEINLGDFNELLPGKCA